VPGDWHRFRVEGLLGLSLLGQTNYARAEPLLLSACAGMKAAESSAEAQGAGIPQAIKSLVDRTIRLYDAQGNMVKAADWRTRRADLVFPDNPFAK
jgi:hypothetical protein